MDSKFDLDQVGTLGENELGLGVGGFVAPPDNKPSNTFGEPTLFPCTYCKRTFTTATGRGVHTKRAHPNKANEAIDVDRTKARWKDEETAMMP